MATSAIAHPKIVSQGEWLEARKRLLTSEKALTKAYDALAALRRQLPWVRIEKKYKFESAGGTETLSELFDGRSQLIIRHFMFGPGWKEGCVGCSFASDHVGGALVHLKHRDVSYVAVSRAPWQEIEAFRKRMGWRFKWVSSLGSDFNYDFHVSFRPEEAKTGKVDYNYAQSDFLSPEMSGLSVFYKNEDDEIFHTYSTYGRGDELALTTYMYLDLTPKGRNETGPQHNLTDWVRHHDRYEGGGHVDHQGRYMSAETTKECCEAAKPKTNGQRGKSSREVLRKKRA
jgi:predicted dithiol-disulfide oxidoreductase (DUF899 family)